MLGLVGCVASGGGILCITWWLVWVVGEMEEDGLVL